MVHRAYARGSMVSVGSDDMSLEAVCARVFGALDAFCTPPI